MPVPLGRASSRSGRLEGMMLKVRKMSGLRGAECLVFGDLASMETLVSLNRVFVMELLQFVAVLAIRTWLRQYLILDD